jgi:hypothetical protein
VFGLSQFTAVSNTILFTSTRASTSVGVIDTNLVHHTPLFQEGFLSCQSSGWKVVAAWTRHPTTQYSNTCPLYTPPCLGLIARILASANLPHGDNNGDGDRSNDGDENGSLETSGRWRCL